MLSGMLRSVEDEGTDERQVGAGEISVDATAELTPEGRQIVRRALILLAVLSSGSLLGSASSLYLLNEAPLLLVALSPIGRHLLLVAPTVDPFAFIAVAAPRRLLFYVPCFFLGRELGPSGLAWLERRAPGAERFLRMLERIFERSRYPAVVLLLGPAMSTIAGNSEMSLRIWLPLVAVGLVIRLSITIAFGEVFRGPIEAMLEWIYQYRLPGTILLVGSIVAYQLYKRRPKS